MPGKGLIPFETLESIESLLARETNILLMARRAKSLGWGPSKTSIALWGVVPVAAVLVASALFLLSGGGTFTFLPTGASDGSAEDLSGKWTGVFLIEESSGNLKCVYQGGSQLGLFEDESGIYGVLFIDNVTASASDCPVPASPPSITIEVSGEQSGRSVSLGGQVAGFSGSIDGDVLSLHPDGCIFMAGDDGCSVSGFWSSRVSMGKVPEAA